MKVIVLAAGYATRLHPLTRDRAKPLLEIAGVPMLSRILDGLLPQLEASEVVVVSNARFADAFRAWARGYAGHGRVRVLDDGTRDDADKLGAIGDLAFALEEAPVGDEDFLVVAGDNLVDLDLGPALDGLRRRATPHIVVRRAERGDGPSPYNEVVLGEDGRVTRFREKPADPESELAAIALYLFPCRVAARVAEYLASGGNPDAPGHLLAWLVEREPVHAVPLEGEWHDVGNFETLAAARARYGEG